MKLCIAEKPSVAREIAHVIGAKTKRDGYFEGNGYQVTWTFGHFCQLCEPDDYNPNWKRWYLPDLPLLPERFDIKLIGNKGVEQQFKIIQKLLDEADEVINCGDAGQEGEVIQRWVLHQAKYRKPFKRLWISSLTEDAIRQGFQHLREGKEFDQLYQAGKSRAIGDWLLGINATRLFTMKYAQGRQLLSLGRVQTPTLAMIVHRHLEIMNFKSEPFWELKTVYRDVTFSSTSGRFKDEAKAMAILEQIKPSEFEVKDVETKKGTESSPRLFDLTSLQIECNNKFGLSADETLKTVQSLYEKKVVSYPRVDTTFLPDDQYPKIPGILSGLHNYQHLTQELLGKKIRKSAKVFNNNKVTDHHAIIPTGSDARGLYGTEAKVFDVIAKRFIAAFYPDCIVSNTVVNGEAAQHAFRAKGKQILDPGWRVVYGPEEPLSATPKPAAKPTAEGEEKEEEVLAVLPHFEAGERGPHEPLLERKATSPPKDYTEATLLRSMETAGKQVEDDELKEALKENGIGRPSTRAAIIETLFKRNYIRKEKKKILPTQTGIDLIQVIRNPTLKSAEMTGQWEKKLRQIEAGEFASEEFLHELKQLVWEMVQEVKQDTNRVTIQPTEAAAKPAEKEPAKKAEKPKKEIKNEPASADGALGNCPACGTGKILKGSQAYGCARFREGCQFRLPMSFKGKPLTEKQVQALLKKGKTSVVKGLVDEATGEKFDGALALSATHELQAEKAEAKEKKPVVLICPKCSQGQMLKGKTAYGCSRFREGCQFMVPFEIHGKALSETNIQALILKGKTPKIKGFTSPKTGNKFEAALKLNEEYKVVYLFD
ncbi:DNA topoisomerase III [Rufibacter radiotolerans]|uniref:DNA topoisomerase n=1 Tax=Rufibacter radiotolerans TaxID=1379910 RepID=A0A0H4VJA1_9BACT|nr:type IA DNA topoisomerase [Rufibacter radiotolerans]AKQ45900.1 DNA topoisomerase III [Rufibacter radiotolerans]